MWQEIIVILIGIIVIGYVGWKTYRFITMPKKGDNPCIGCPGCSLKEIQNKTKPTQNTTQIQE